MAGINFSVLLAVAILWTDQISAKSINGNSDIGKESDYTVLKDQQTVLKDKFTGLKDQLPVLEHQFTVLENNASVLEDKIPVFQNQLAMLKDQLVVLENQLPVLQDTDLAKESTPIMLENQQLEGSLAGDMFFTADTECNYPFEKVGKNCYLFSDTKLSYDNARDYCESVSLDNTHEITLAMLEYSNEEDQDILDAAADKQNNLFWLGGYSKDGTTFNWLDGREVDLHAPFWYYALPQSENCTASFSYLRPGTNVSKSTLLTHKCDADLHFICQMGCPNNFQRIDDNCYMRSEDFGLPELSWNDAREYCTSLTMPDGYRADLAVLDLHDQNVYKLMNSLVASDDNDYLWIGASHDEGFKYKWIDGRELNSQSMFWVDFAPFFYDYDTDVILANDPDYNGPFLFDYEADAERAFVCQIFNEN